MARRCKQCAPGQVVQVSEGRRAPRRDAGEDEVSAADAQLHALRLGSHPRRHRAGSGCSRAVSFWARGARHGFTEREGGGSGPPGGASPWSSGNALEGCRSPKPAVLTRHAPSCTSRASGPRSPASPWGRVQARPLPVLALQQMGVATTCWPPGARRAACAGQAEDSR